MTITLTIGLFLLAAILLQGLRKIPVDPPHAALLTKLGEIVEPNEVRGGGWHFFLFYPYYSGFILINMSTQSKEIVCDKVRTTDRAESKIPISIAFHPDPDNLPTFIANKKEAGVMTQLVGEITERVREWAISREEGPENWVELVESRMEAISILVRKIAGHESEFLPKIEPKEAQKVPTWIWLRYYTSVKPSAWTEREKKWATGGTWEPVEEVIREIRMKYGDEGVEKLEESVEKRRQAIYQLRDGTAKLKLMGLGIILSRLNVADVQVLGEVATAAEQEAREAQELLGEKKEITNFIERVNSLMEARPKGAGLTREQAVEQVQLSLGKATKAIDAKSITFDEATAEIASRILGRKS